MQFPANLHSSPLPIFQVSRNIFTIKWAMAVTHDIRHAKVGGYTESMWILQLIDLQTLHLARNPCHTAVVISGKWLMSDGVRVVACGWTTHLFAATAPISFNRKCNKNNKAGSRSKNKVQITVMRKKKNKHDEVNSKREIGNGESQITVDSQGQKPLKNPPGEPYKKILTFPETGKIFSLKSKDYNGFNYCNYLFAYGPLIVSITLSRFRISFEPLFRNPNDWTVSSQETCWRSKVSPTLSCICLKPLSSTHE